MAVPSKEELQLIAMLRDKVKDVLEDDYSRSDSFLVRWIRIKDGNLDNAANMIRATMIWRKEFKISEILNKPMNEFCVTNFPVTIEGKDRLGQPLVLTPVGDWDLSKAASDDIRYEQFKIYCLQIYEKIMAQIKAFDAQRPSGSPPITQFTSVYDWQGFAFKPLFNMSVDKHIVNLIGIVEANYPETLGNCIYINCPSMITSVLSIIKPVMSAKTFGKIKWFGTEKSQWQDVILNFIDPSQLPPRYGGVKTS